MDQTDHFIDAFAHKNNAYHYVMTFASYQVVAILYRHMKCKKKVTLMFCFFQCNFA